MAKNHNRIDDWEDRARLYREWRYQVKHGTYVFDVDQVEWRSTGDGDLYPVAVIELTRPDDYVRCPEAYLKTVLTRYLSGNPQSVHLRGVAKALDVPLWVVVFESPLNRFWIYNADEDTRWWELNEAQYRRWLMEDCRSGKT